MEADWKPVEKRNLSDAPALNDWIIHWSEYQKGIHKRLENE